MNARCIPARCTTAPTSAPACASGAERRWLNKKGHKADAKVEYSERLQEARLHYQIPRPEPRGSFLRFRRRLSRRDHGRQPLAQLPARRDALREALAWLHAHDRAQVSSTAISRSARTKSNLEFGNSTLLFAEGTLSRRRVNDRLAPRKRLRARFGRCGSPRRRVVSDTDIAQAFGRITWLLPQGENGRFKLRGEVGAMAVGDFDALPPELRFFAGGDRSIRGFDYHEIGETNANGKIIGGKYLAVGQRRVRVLLQRGLGRGGVRRRRRCVHRQLQAERRCGVGVRWRSPLGPIRVDFGFPGANTRSAHSRTAGACTCCWGRTYEPAAT